MTEPRTHGHAVADAVRVRVDAPDQESSFQRGPGSAERRSRTLAAAAVAAQRPDVSRGPHHRETDAAVGGLLPGSADAAASRRRSRPSSLRLPSAESTPRSWDSTQRTASITPSDLPPQRSRPRVADAAGPSGRHGAAGASQSLSRAAMLSLQAPQPAHPPRRMRGDAGSSPPPLRHGAAAGRPSAAAAPGRVASSHLALGIEDLTSKFTGLASPRTSAAPAAPGCSDGADPAPLCTWPDAGRGVEAHGTALPVPASAGRARLSPPPRSAPSHPRARESEAAHAERRERPERPSLLARRRRGLAETGATKLSLGEIDGTGAGSAAGGGGGREAGAGRRRRPHLALALDFDATAAPTPALATPGGGGAGHWPPSSAGYAAELEGPRVIDARAGEQRRMQGVLSRIGPSLFVTGEAGASRADELAGQGVTHVVNCAGTAVRTADAVAGRMRVLTLRLRDAGDQCLLPYLPATLAFLQEAAAGGAAAAVHCAMGVSRSSAVAVADVIRREGLTADDAFRSVRRSRSVACPNPGFHFQLVEWGAARPGKAASMAQPNTALLYRVGAYMHRRAGSGHAPPGTVEHLGAEWLPLLEGPVQLPRADDPLPASLFRPRPAHGEASLPDNDTGCANAGFDAAEAGGAAAVGACAAVHSAPPDSPSHARVPQPTGRHASQRRTLSFFPESGSESSGSESHEEEDEEDEVPASHAPTARPLPAASEALGGDEVSPAYLLVHRGRCCTLRSTQTPPLLAHLSLAGATLLHQTEGVDDAGCSLVWDGGRREWEAVGAAGGQGPFVRDEALAELLQLALRTAHQVEVNPEALHPLAAPSREASDAWLALTQPGGAGARCGQCPPGGGCDEKAGVDNEEEEDEEDEEDEEEDELMLSVATSMSQPRTPPSAKAGASFIASRSGGSSIQGMESSDGPAPRLASRRHLAAGDAYFGFA